jgi:Pyridoxamine 5'-phosphate oxidase
MDNDLSAIARDIIDANTYMVLGTADEDGRPWTSPVFYSAWNYREFYWISSPAATQVRNIAKRPEISIVIFDSRVPVGSGQAVYMSATAGQVADDEIAAAVTRYPGPSARGGRTIAPEEVRPPARWRLYRATASEHSILCPLSSADPCPEHGGRLSDHRAPVTP